MQSAVVKLTVHVNYLPDNTEIRDLIGAQTLIMIMNINKLNMSIHSTTIKQ